MNNAFPRWLSASLALALLLLFAGGAVFYRTQESDFRRHVENELKTIAQLKADQLTTWRADQLAEAAELMNSRYFIRAVTRWMEERPAGVPNEILNRFKAVQAHYGYSDIILADTAGRIRLSLAGLTGPVDADAAKAISAAFRGESPVLTDLHPGPDGTEPHIGVVTPLFEKNGVPARPVGAVIFVSDARRFLYPLLQSWPVPSRTAEALLVRREADHVLFLTELRHRQGTALKLRIPLTEKDVPAVSGALGKEGVLRGRDYRGVDVLAVIRPVPGSTWIVVAKMDSEEAFETQRRFSLLVLASVLGIVAAAAAAVGMVWQRNAKAQYQVLFRSETARRISEERYHRLFEHMREGFAFCEMIFENGDAVDFVYLSVNTAFETLTGLKDVVGKRVSEVIPGIRQADPGLFEIYGRVARTGDPEKFEMFVKALEQWFSISVYSPEHGTFVAVFDVVTERKRAEEERLKLEAQFRQAQKMEAVGRLAGGVAHDFNNMLQAVLGYAEILLHKVGPDSPLRGNLQEIQKAAKKAAKLTRQLLAFARRQTVSPRVLDMNETVAGMLEMLRRLIGEDIDLAWKPFTGIRPVKMDPSQVDQILANLVVNARDAITGVGKVTIETGMAQFDEAYCADHAGFIPGRYAMLAVSDDGCGMDRTTLEQIFEPFFTTKKLGEGTGLGLATVYGIVKQNGGFINVYSERGKGTTFRIYLPPVEEETSAPIAAIPAATPVGGAETILLVEDDEAILALGKTMLERLGYTVLAAKTPSAALSHAKEHAGKISLIITDVVMPGMNGRELAEKLVSILPDLKCMFMSGYTANVIAHRGVLDMGVHFLQKPFSMDSLAAKVREVLER